jgi:putative transposase
MFSAFYATDLTDAEWHILSPFLPAAKPGGRPRTHDVRQIVNAILYVLRTGCHWRLLPHEYPNWKTVYDYFWKWRQRGLWQTINEILRGQVRRAAGRTAPAERGYPRQPVSQDNRVRRSARLRRR